MAVVLEELTASIAEVASQNHDTEQTSHAVSELSAAESQAITYSSSEVVSLVRAIGEVSQLMNHLAQRSAEVGQSTGLIRDISD